MPSTRNTTISKKRTASQALDEDEIEVLGSDTESDTRYGKMLTVKTTGALASNLDTVIDPTDAVNEPPPPPLSRFIQQLISKPSRQDGLDSICNLINSRIEEIRSKHSLDEAPGPSTSSIASALDELTQKQFGPYGKVGMFIRKETVDALEKALLEEEVQDDQGEVADEGLEEVDPASIELDEVLTAENVEVTLEGLDKDLLGVNSQAALNKLTKFVSKTIEENHPAGKNRVVPPATVPPKNTTLPTEEPQPVPDNSNARANPNDPFKFAFISVVATYDAKCRVSLEDLHSKVRCCTFDPTWFHNAVLTFPKSECRVAIFENGKFVITGVATIKNALIAARNTLEVLRMCGFDPEISKRNFRAKNLTAMMELGVHVDITGFAEKHSDNSYLDQDTFGAVTHLPEKKKGAKVHKGGFGMCFLIFATGRIIMVGGKNEKHLIKTFQETTLGLLKPFAYGWNS